MTNPLGTTNQLVMSSAAPNADPLDRRERAILENFLATLPEGLKPDEADAMAWDECEQSQLSVLARRELGARLRTRAVQGAK